MTWTHDDVPRIGAAIVQFVPTDGSDTIVFDDRARRWYRLPGTAAAIWAAIDGERSVAALTEFVATTYSTSAEAIGPDVEALLDGLAERQLLDTSN